MTKAAIMLTILLVFVTTSYSADPTVKKEVPSKTFFGASFGEKLNVASMTPTSDPDGNSPTPCQQFFSPKNIEMTMAGVQPTRIAYGTTYDGKFAYGQAHFPEMARAQLYQYLTSIYGQPTQRMTLSSSSLVAWTKERVSKVALVTDKYTPSVVILTYEDFGLKDKILDCVEAGGPVTVKKAKK